MKILSITVDHSLHDTPDCYRATVEAIDEGEELTTKAMAETPHAAVSNALQHLGRDLMEYRARGLKVDVRMVVQP